MRNRLFPLKSYEFIKISGSDSISFLQGQLSCNTELLSPQRSLTGALCNLKGRVIADFRLLQQGEHYLMQCAEGMAAEIVTTLNKYAVFSKVEITTVPNTDKTGDGNADSAPTVLGIMDNDVDAALQILELKLPNNANEVTVTDHCCAVRIFGPAKRIELWFHSPSALELFARGFAGPESADLQPWLRADIEAGIIHVSPALSAEYTPQLLNYDIAGLIDFKKGCYSGQEIVARMFYRGTAKKRLHLASSSHTIGSSSAVVYGDKEGDRGEILAYSNSDSDQPKLLTILPAELDESVQPLRLSDQVDSVVSILELPYSSE
jgi:folate-binding protein YgfZ